MRLHLSPRTVEWYGYVLRPAAARFRVWPGVEEVEAWLGSAPSRESARSWLRAFRAFTRWVVRRYPLEDGTRLLDVGREVALPRAERKLFRVFTPTELRRILIAASMDPIDNAAVTLLLDTGIRIGELASLRVESFDASGVVQVHGKTGDRRVPVSPESRTAVMAIAEPMGPLFVWRPNGGGPRGKPRPMASTTLGLRVRAVVAAAGLSGSKLGPHTFRHTFATMYLRGGGQLWKLQHLLGHASVRQTMVYLSMVDEDHFDEHARLSPLRQLSRHVGEQRRLIG